jgi:L-threonylcarbamoyladenylate synthase
MVDFHYDIEQCLAVLKNGGLILYPTDTIWGIGCDAANAKAVEKIYALKERPDEKTMIVLVADEKEVLQHTANPDLTVFDYLQKNLTPITVIYEGAIGLADNLVARDGTIAIRICRDEFCKHLIKRFRKPIVSTSANISGEPAPKNFPGISDKIKNGIDYIVQYRRDDLSIAEPSTVIAWEKGKARILRP